MKEISAESIFSCIPKEKQFIENDEKILQKRQAEFYAYAPLFIKWATHSPTYAKIAPIIDRAYIRCEQYLDDVFYRQFPTRREFWSRLWELFLCDFLITRKFILNQNKKKEWTPDFCVIHTNGRVWIEASAPAENESIEKIQDWTYKLDGVSNPRYLALSSTFTTKADKWNSTYRKNGCDECDAFIIAINWNSIDSWSSDKWMLAVLYWIGLTQIDLRGKVTYQNLSSLVKWNLTLVDTNYFQKPEFSHVSGVIYLESEIHPEKDDLYVEHAGFHFIPNINAKNPLSEDFIEQLNLHVPISFESK